MPQSFDHEAALREIIDLELNMFLATPNEGGISACQQRPETFRVMRRMTHEPLDDTTLALYLADLQAAAAVGRNLMVEKYARMDDRLPPLSTSPLLDEIADEELAFLEEASVLFPHVIRRGGGGMFRRYLRCELETLSQGTLESYAREVHRARSLGKNMAVERHRCLARLLGRGSLEEYEAARAQE